MLSKPYVPTNVLRFTALRYAIIFTVRRFGPLSCSEVLSHLESRGFEVGGQRRLEVVRSVLNREATGTRRRRPTMRRLADDTFLLRPDPLATTTRKRWESRLPTLR
jgi:hypothetical protein